MIFIVAVIVPPGLLLICKADCSEVLIWHMWRAGGSGDELRPDLADNRQGRLARTTVTTTDCTSREVAKRKATTK